MRPSSSLAAGLVLGSSLAATLASGAPPTSCSVRSGPAVTPVVELFTSEGCSSCPPAEALLNRMVTEQPVKGAEVVALGFHVDYWDQSGWTDTFSSAAATQRQRAYQAALGLPAIYTPQMVVNGSKEFLGSDGQAARSAVQEAGKVQTSALGVSAEVKDAQATVIIRVPAAAAERPGDLLLVVTEAGLSTEVRRGENAGRRLLHAPVVRTLTRVGDAQAGDVQTEIKLSPGWKLENVRLVAFVQTKGNRHIVGAGSCGVR